MRDCAKRIAEKAGIKYEEAKKIVQSADAQARKRANEGEDYDDAVGDIIRERIDNVERNIIQQKANAARNFIIKKQTENTLQAFIDGGLTIQDSVRAMLEGVERPIIGARASVAAHKDAVKSLVLSEFVGKMTRENLMTIFSDGKLSDEIGLALWDISEKRKPTGNKQAIRIAEIIHEVREGQRLSMNKSGADISETSGYIMPQRHDLLEMRRAGADKWVETMEGLLNKKRTFGGDYDDFKAALYAAYDAMISGVRLTDPIQQDAKLFQFSGPANLAKKLSRARELHFKDYASWKTWNDLYGMRSLHEGVIESMVFDAENTAMLERFGTNPEAVINSAVSEIIKKNRGKMEAGDGTQKKIESMIAGLMEKQKIPANATFAAVGSVIRAFNSVTMLGGALISSIADIGIKALAYNHNGKNFLSATSQSFIDVAYGFKSKKKRVEFASMLGVYIESIIGDVGSRFSSFDNLQGKSAKVQRLFFRLNGLTWWTDSHKAAFSRTMAHDLGRKAGDSFDKLDADTQRVLGNYRIDANDWDVMRASVVTMEDNRPYILADNIKNKKVAEKFVMYLLDQQESAVITPGVREQRISTFGNLQRGTAAGEFARTIMQFKNFPITIGTKVIGRAVYGKGKPDYQALAYLFLVSGTFGYLAGAMKDIIKGKTPKDPMKIETVYAAMAQGGGMGIMGDLLFQDYDFGRSVTSTLAGPTFSRLDTVAKIYAQGARGEGTARGTAMFAINSIPFNNLFYTRAALDHMLLLQMQEELSPGYLRRMETNAKNTYGQELMFK